MIINRLTMHNFGVYAGTNTFEFTSKKPIVLIGGMNGRGKTTFLEAILLSLYGANSIAYKESDYNSYNQYLRSYVNNNSWSKSSYVEIEFLLNESSNDTYLVRREWNALSRITKEKISVQQNGVYSEFLTQNWAMFVENILPSALSSFYFFDGEKIAELAVAKTDDQMKASIRSMLGMTTLDVLKNDLGRIVKKINRNNKADESNKHLETLREERDQAISELEKIDESISIATKKVEDLQEALEQLHKKYELQGGAVLEQRQSLMQKRAQIQTEIAQNAELLVGMAATELPIFLVRDLVSQIKLQAEDEHNDFIMQQALEQMDDYLSDFEMQYPESIEASRIFVDYVRKQTEADLAPRLYEMSDHALFQMNDLVENTLQQSVNNTKSLLVNKADLKKQLDTVESYLTLDIDEKDLTAIYDQIKAKEADLVEAQVEYNRLQQERSYINSTVITKSAEYSRDIEIFLQKLELHDDSERMMKYSNIALRILEAYAVELQRRKTGTLGATITKCYKQLANKKNLIQEIVMNPETLDMQYLDENGNEVSKESLSAGEKQLMIIAILWALALCSKKKLPVIIDTPLSRLDSQHRTSIISTYFPNASDQTIILSTDTEIDQNYYEMMKNSVGDEFTLVYSEETKSTSIKKGYFQEL
ncbi:DNA sulfur modification protein DndD [Mediterraneibacter faecis]|uniref:DNA sulfur modification protein DndD n=1 Tax=Mediterraneibacter faecis TaxID=592978 RepID=UPI001C02FDBD|nr:DNA sulfur modification protein DndD [Mediterraneibacter faecis]MBT9617260.1 DNA sulfur modification protein DndD [Mediterraneibacter faecis]